MMILNKEMRIKMNDYNQKGLIKSAIVYNRRSNCEWRRAVVSMNSIFPWPLFLNIEILTFNVIVLRTGILARH